MTKHEKMEPQPKAQKEQIEISVEKLPNEQITYLKKSIEFMNRHGVLKGMKSLVKDGMATEEDYKMAKKEYETVRDEVSVLDLQEGWPDDISDLKTLEDFQRKLAELEPPAKPEELKEEDTANTTKEKIENISQEFEPYSGKLKAGDDVKYGSGENWKVFGYDTSSGNAILERFNGLAREIRVVGQEELYAQNQGSEAKNRTQEPNTSEQIPVLTNEMTLDEIEEKIKFAKDTGRVPGIGPEGLSYWEEQKKLLLERQQAEETERKFEEANNLLEQKYAELDEVLKQEKFARDTARPLETAMWEEKRKALEKKIRELEKKLEILQENPEGKSWKNEVKNVYTKAKEKGKKVWGFVKERLKGLGTFGFWELKQAEVMRRGTKETAEEVAAIGENIQEEEGLGLEEAQKEATELRETLGGGATKEQYQEISEQITKSKKEQNEKVEKEIVEYAVMQLEKRLEENPIIQGYRSAHSGEKVMTEDNVAALRAELAVELKKLRNGQIRKDRINYASLMRKNLDPKWWARYIYGPLEAVLMTLGAKYVITKLAAEKAIAATGKTAAEKTTVEAMQVGLKDTVWGEAKRQLVSHGIANPTNAQIQQIAATISKESFVNVPPWNIAGQVLHTKMQAGYMLNLKGALAEIVKIKAVL